MIIHYERSGGFTGLRQHAVIDSLQLTTDEQAKLEGLVETAVFFEREIELPAAQGADRFHYTLTIESGGRRRTVSLSEEAIPVEWLPLIDWINTFARLQRRTD
jgi:hypothetical protein